MKKNKTDKVVPIKEPDLIPQEVLSALYNKLHEKTDHMFNELDYQWVLGRRVYKDLTDILTPPYCMTTLYGIPVSIDDYNDNKIELWKNITVDLTKE